MSASTTNAAASAAAAAAAATERKSELRACSTRNCQVNKYVEVTKRKCAQFVTKPYIMSRPLVVNGKGKTSIFQVGGDEGYLENVAALASTTGSENIRPIYRIKPGTHAHVINYVFIDEGSESMEKAKSEDQEAMRLLQESQRESATAKLLKLITTHKGGGAVAAPVTAPASAVPSTTAIASAAVAPPPPPPLVANSSAHVTTPQLHPNLAIASVEGADVSRLQEENIRLRQLLSRLNATQRS
ncbi:CG4788 [Drosophila busckii]|uniref:CG4788 n=1 Tax=Drosophila busckii TaxID=30019 RepID=A0A0M5J977_DROBS|nr:uncharacterized protein LOC108607648 [Drosophila busckii]ALC39306.1 CG4788 [Drosophila busckii]